MCAARSPLRSSSGSVRTKRDEAPPIRGRAGTELERAGHLGDERVHELVDRLVVADDGLGELAVPGEQGVGGAGDGLADERPDPVRPAPRSPRRTSWCGAWGGAASGGAGSRKCRRGATTVTLTGDAASQSLRTVATAWPLDCSSARSPGCSWGPPWPTGSSSGGSRARTPSSPSPSASTSSSTAPATSSPTLQAEAGQLREERARARRAGAAPRTTRSPESRRASTTSSARLRRGLRVAVPGRHGAGRLPARRDVRTPGRGARPHAARHGRPGVRAARAVRAARPRGREGPQGVLRLDHARRSTRFAAPKSS